MFKRTSKHLLNESIGAVLDLIELTLLEIKLLSMKIVVEISLSSPRTPPRNNI